MAIAMKAVRAAGRGEREVRSSQTKMPA